MSKKQLLAKIENEFIKMDYGYGIVDNTIYFYLVCNNHPHLSVFIHVEVYTGKKFSLYFEMPNIQKLSLSELGNIAFSAEVGISRVGINNDFDKAILAIDMNNHSVKYLLEMICDTMAKVTPYILSI